MKLTWFDLYTSTNPKKLIEKEQARIEAMPYGKEREDNIAKLNKICEKFGMSMVQKIINSDK